MRLTTLSISLVAFFSVGVANVSAQDKTVAILGAGNKSCGSWNQARKEGGAISDIYEAWVAGFLSGANSIISNSELHIDTLQQARTVTDAEGLWGWVDSYCKANPLDSVAQAADALSAELIRRAAKANH